MLEDGTAMDEDRTLFAEEPLAKLVVLQSNVLEGEFPIEGAGIILGRDETAGIAIDDKRISRQHCKIWLNGNTYSISDMGSSNGTFLNGKRVTEQTLKSGDKIQIGSNQFRFSVDILTAPDKKRKPNPIIKITAAILGLAVLVFAGYRIIPAFLPAKPHKVILQKLWEQPTFASVTSSSALGDINGDSQMDIVTADMGGNLYAMDTRQGGSVWNAPLITKGSALTGAPLLADINEVDGELDVITATATQGVWTINGGDRRLIWNGALDSPASGTPAGADINDDGTADVFVGSQRGTLTCFDGRQGGVVWQVKLGAPLLTAPKLGDLNQDGYVDVVIGAQDFRIHALDGRNGHTLWVYMGSNSPSTAAIADMNRDKIPDVAVMTLTHVVALEGAKGAVLWQWEIPKIARPVTGDLFRPLAPAIADLNQDKIPDVVASTARGHVYAVDGASEGKAYLWDYGVSVSPKTAPALYDMNQDRITDVIVGDLAGNLTVLDGTTGHQLNQIQIGNPIVAMPVIGDFDGNKTADIGVGTKNKTLVAIQTESRMKKKNQIVWNSF